MIFKGGVGARFRLGAHVPSTLAAGHATKTIALGCLPTGFSATEPFVELWSSERLHADSSQAQGLPAGAGVGRLRRSAFCFLGQAARHHGPLLQGCREQRAEYSQLDHRRFLEIAAAWAVKTAAYLELYEQKALPVRVETAPGRELLSRILALLNNF